jgi:hypothetical protein
MRYFVLFGIPAIIVITICIGAAMAWYDKRKPGTGQQAMGNLKAIGTGANAVRALDQLLTDPTLIGSTKWREHAQSIVQEWYGNSPKQLGS